MPNDLFSNIHHVAIICYDYQKSKHFYAEILGLEIILETYRADRQSWKLDLSLNGHYVIELFSFPSAPKRLIYPEAAGLRHLAFEVENIDITIEILAGKNINAEPVRVDEITGKRFTFIFDPDNLPVEIYEK